MKFSKRCREQAAHILALCASNCGMGTSQAQIEMSYTYEAGRLALHAMLAAPYGLARDEIYAYGEAMLRTGWSPE